MRSEVDGRGRTRIRRQRKFASYSPSLFNCVLRLLHEPHGCPFALQSVASRISSDAWQAAISAEGFFGGERTPANSAVRSEIVLGSRCVRFVGFDFLNGNDGVVFWSFRLFRRLI